jgi:hypothetical protein
MANEAASLSAVAQGGTYTGTALNFGSGTTFYANHSLVAEVSGFAGSGAIEVQLQVSHDGTNWVMAAVAILTGTGPAYAHVPGLPAGYLRAVITDWDPGVTAGAVSATVAGC